MSRRRGFTPIELMVVIAIIALYWVNRGDWIVLGPVQRARQNRNGPSAMSLRRTKAAGRTPRRPGPDGAMSAEVKTYQVASNRRFITLPSVNAPNQIPSRYVDPFTERPSTKTGACMTENQFDVPTTEGAGAWQRPSRRVHDARAWPSNKDELIGRDALHLDRDRGPQRPQRGVEPADFRGDQRPQLPPRRRQRAAGRRHPPGSSRAASIGLVTCRAGDGGGWRGDFRATCTDPVFCRRPAIVFTRFQGYQGRRSRKETVAARIPRGLGGGGLEGEPEHHDGVPSRKTPVQGRRSTPGGRFGSKRSMSTLERWEDQYRTPRGTAHRDYRRPGGSLGCSQAARPGSPPDLPSADEARPLRRRAKIITRYATTSGSDVDASDPAAGHAFGADRPARANRNDPWRCNLGRTFES